MNQAITILTCAGAAGQAQAFTWARSAQAMVRVFDEALAARRGGGA
ncbi:hypothetical protein [Tepidiphilus succinatimandens]|nr:hypothetical protein [Tepidiphilus succinatimandens]